MNRRSFLKCLLALPFAGCAAAPVPPKRPIIKDDEPACHEEMKVTSDLRDVRYATISAQDMVNYDIKPDRLHAHAQRIADWYFSPSPLYEYLKKRGL